MFDLYALLLMLSGLLLIAAAVAMPGQTTGGRALNLVFGVGFFGYGFYLEFLFTGGTYFVFYYALIVPILLLVRTFKARKAAKLAREQRASAIAQADREAQEPSVTPGTAPTTP